MCAATFEKNDVLSYLLILWNQPCYFVRIGIYINVFNWNRHVTIYFRQFYADKGVKGPKVDPEYGDCLWFRPNWSTFSCTLLPVHVTTVSDLTLFNYLTSRMCLWWKNQFEHGDEGIPWSINPLFAQRKNYVFECVLYLNKYGMQSNNCGMCVYVLLYADFKYIICSLLRYLFPPFVKMAVVNTTVTISQTLRHLEQFCWRCWIALWIAIPTMLFVIFNNITIRAILKDGVCQSLLFPYLRNKVIRSIFHHILSASYRRRV